MKYVKIDKDMNPIGDLLSEKELRKELYNVSLPEDSQFLQDRVLKPLGYATVWYPPGPTAEQMPTSFKKMDFEIVYDENLDMFSRKIILTEVDEQTAYYRWYRRRKQNIAKAKHLLKESDFSQSPDYFIMSEEWKEYRKKIREILRDEETDPYLQKFPEVPAVFKDNDDPLKTAKEVKLIKLKAYTKEQLNIERPRVDTGLGFEVDGGKEDLLFFENGQKLKLTELRDADNQMQTINLEDWDTILDAIRTRAFNILKFKWETEELIKNATTIEELDSIVLIKD